MMATFGVVELFTTPGYESQGSFGSVVQLFEQPESLEAGQKSSSVIIGSGLRSSVPGIDVSAHQQYLIRFFRAQNLENKVIGLSIINRLILKNEFKSNFLTPVLHPLQHLSVFNSNSGNGNFLVVLPSGMR